LIILSSRNRIMEEHNYKEVNKDMWNSKVDIHFNSEFYDVDSFKEGRNSLTDIELDLFGDVTGKSILHLQCHFGQDTLSLARMGAQVTGMDISSEALAKARELNDELGLSGRFIESDLYSLPENLEGQFDIVYTSYGTIGWLPDINRWAEVVTKFMKPGGRFVFAEFHPVLWMFDKPIKEIVYPYMRSQAILEDEEGTYANKEHDLQTSSVTWNHGLGDVIGALLSQELKLTHFEEFDYSPYNIFPKATEEKPKQFRVEGMGKKLPLVYALEMTK